MIIIEGGDSREENFQIFKKEFVNAYEQKKDAKNSKKKVFFDKVSKTFDNFLNIGKLATGVGLTTAVLTLIGSGIASVAGVDVGQIPKYAVFLGIGSLFVVPGIFFGAVVVGAPLSIVLSAFEGLTEKSESSIESLARKEFAARQNKPKEINENKKEEVQERLNIKVDNMNLFPPSAQEIIKGITKNLNKCKENLNSLDNMVQLTLTNIEKKYLPIVLEQYLSVPIEFRSTLKNTQKMTSEETLLDSLKDLDNLVSQAADKITENVITAQSVTNRQIKSLQM